MNASSGIITGKFAGDGSALTSLPTSPWTSYNQTYNGATHNSIRKLTGNVGIATDLASNNFQVGANPHQFSEFSLRSMKTNDLGRGLKNDSGFASLREISVLNSEKAQDAMRIIDKAIQDVTSNRGELGAFQRNNLESNLNYLRIAHENAVSSESVIRDADIAEEMAKFTRDQIMVEASTSMLAQANQNSMAVLKLLQ